MQLPGTLIEGKYEILGKIREGGMGTIYRVRHRLLDEIRVVKVLKPEALSNEEMKRRFVEEARTATRLKHPNICTIHDFALDEEGKAYLVMEFIDGVNLADLIRRQGPRGLGLSLEVAHQSLAALAYLHRKSVVHRDVAPDNLMLTHDEEGRPLVKLIDLGIAKTLDRPGEMTSTGVFLGKLKYASPEQFGALPAGEKLDGRSDLYALGVVLYEMLTGKYPFVGESPTELLRAHLFDPPLPFSKTDPDGKVPPEARAALLKALEKRREDRFATADEFNREIAGLQRLYRRPDDLDDTAQIISRLRTMPPAGSDPTVTPSAQNRLDEQFAAATTPHPSPSTLRDIADREKTEVVAAGFSSGGRADVDTQPLDRPRGRPGWLLPAAVAAGVLAAAALVSFGVLRRAAPEPSPAPAAPAKPSVTAAAPPQPTVVVQPTSAPAASEPIAPAEPSPLPAAPPAEDTRARTLAEKSRSDAADARRRAERAGAPRQAAALYETARAREKEAQQTLSRKDYLPARVSFDAAKVAFQSAAIAAAQFPRPSPRSAEQIGAQPAPTTRSEPARRAVVPTAVPAAESPREPAKVPPPAPTEPPRREAGDADRIRDTIRRYVEAQNTLDADRYAKVFPSVNRARVQAAFESYRSQTLEVEIQKIDIEPGGSRATVRGREKRLIVPRVGSEQRDSRTTTIQLEKRGDGWVITGLS